MLFLGSWPVILNAPAPYHPLESAALQSTTLIEVDTFELQPCVLKLGAQIASDTQVSKLQKGKMGDMILQGFCALWPFSSNFI